MSPLAVVALPEAFVVGVEGGGEESGEEEGFHFFRIAVGEERFLDGISRGWIETTRSWSPRSQRPYDEDLEERHTSQSDRQELHALVDHIAASDLGAERKILRALADPVWQSVLAAPLDDEPETDQERAEVEAARSEKGSGSSHQELLREFGA